MGEWLKPADCKSAAPCGLRRFESSPVHQRLVGAEREVNENVQRTSSEITELTIRGVALGEREIWEASGKPVRAWVAQLVERVLGKDEVTGSIPVPGSTQQRAAGIKVGMSGGNSVVESLPSKQMVAGSSPVPRSIVVTEK